MAIINLKRKRNLRRKRLANVEDQHFCVAKNENRKRKNGRVE